MNPRPNSQTKAASPFDPSARPTNRTMPKPAGPVIGPGSKQRSSSPFNIRNYQMLSSKAPSTGFGFSGMRSLSSNQ